MNHLFSVHLHSGRVTRRTGLNGSDQILPVWLLEGGRSQQVHRNRDVPLCSSFCSVEVCCFRRDFRFPARQLWLFRRSQTGGGGKHAVVRGLIYKPRPSSSSSSSLVPHRDPGCLQESLCPNVSADTVKVTLFHSFNVRMWKHLGGGGVYLLK